MPIVAGALSPEEQHKLERWRTQETPCYWVYDMCR